MSSRRHCADTLTVSRDELDDKRPPNNSVSLVTRKAVLLAVPYATVNTARTEFNSPSMQISQGGEQHQEEDYISNQLSIQ